MAPLARMDNQPLGVRSASVGEPRTIGEGVRAHVQYTVRVELLQLCAGLTGLTFAVPRRFSDFAWLRDRLRDAYPWLIVPALPEKSALNKTQLLATGKKDDEFQDMRLRALQRWVERVASHPELSASGACAASARRAARTVPLIRPAPSFRPCRALQAVHQHVVGGDGRRARGQRRGAAHA